MKTEKVKVVNRNNFCVVQSRLEWARNKTDRRVNLIPELPLNIYILSICTSRKMKQTINFVCFYLLKTKKMLKICDTSLQKEKSSTNFEEIEPTPNAQIQFLVFSMLRSSVPVFEIDYKNSILVHLINYFSTPFSSSSSS